MPTKSNTLKKKAFLKKFRETLGNITKSCEAAQINRCTYYDWIKKDAKFAEEVDGINEEAIDFAETSLKKQISEGNTTATIFYLKTKGKSRGYIETHELETNGIKFVIDSDGHEAAEELEGR